MFCFINRRRRTASARQRGTMACGVTGRRTNDDIGIIAGRKRRAPGIFAFSGLICLCDLADAEYPSKNALLPHSTTQRQPRLTQHARIEGDT
jgi:hypothetical protein